MPNFQIEKIKRQPMRARSIWQGKWFRLPTWIDEPGQEPYRPWATIWVGVARDAVGPSNVMHPDDRSFAKMLAGLTETICDSKAGGYRPGTIQVDDPALAEHLSGVLAEAGIGVECRPSLPAVEEYLELIVEQNNIDDGPPGPLEGEGVTVERMRRFAEAAAAFYEAGPWDELLDADLIRIKSPPAPEGLGVASVLGAGGEAFGMGFFNSPDDMNLPHNGMVGIVKRLETSSLWSLAFDPLIDNPIGDADLWDDHQLPVAGPNAYPCVIRFGPGARVRRPDAKTLAFIEGLLWTVAKTTPEQMDAGQWTQCVDTADGPATFTLELPDLLTPQQPGAPGGRATPPDRRAMERTMSRIEQFISKNPVDDMDQLNALVNEKFLGVPPAEMEFEPQTPLEEAQDLCYDAFEARGRRQLQLVRKAIQICPDCADAYALLAERTADASKAIELYAKAVDAGTRTLGPDRFTEDEGEFWGHVDTRPYMRARCGLAQCLQTTGRLQEAAGHYQALLRLNPGDNQGVRHFLIPLLVELGDDAAASDLLNEYEDDTASSLAFTRVLLHFRAEGDTKAARESLRTAAKANPHVIGFLTDLKSLPARMPSSYTIGSEEEAVICIQEILSAWDASPGAVQWLHDCEKRTRLRKAKRKPSKRKTAKRPK